MESPGSDKENNNRTLPPPEQDRRRCYQELLEEIDVLEETESVGLEALQTVGTVIHKVTKLESNEIESLKKAEEAVLDCMVLAAASKLLKKCVKAVDVSIDTYNSVDFANKIIYFTSEENGHTEYNASNLQHLSEFVNNIIPEKPHYRCVYGAYDLTDLPKPKQKKERVKQQREVYQKKQPEQLSKTDKEEKGIEEYVKVFYKILEKAYHTNNERPINYYDFVMDSESFNNTVENMFYTSFLVRDGKIHLDLDKNEIPLIKPVNKRKRKEFEDNNGVNFQIISSITYDKWLLEKRVGLIEKYKKEN